MNHVKIPHLNSGFVLKNTPATPHKASLIDQHYGRIDAISFKEIPSAGSLIHYRLEVCPIGLARLHDAKLSHMPLELARHDILFLHHLLELCYYFIPLATYAEGLFDLLQFLYSVDIQVWNDAIKKVFLFRILSAIGMYSTQLQVDKQILNALMHTPFETPLLRELAAAHKTSIEQWLMSCVREHPYIQKFKTLHFLTRE